MLSRSPEPTSYPADNHDVRSPSGKTQRHDDRYERGSIVLTSNKRFSEWGELIGDDTLAGAILDRLLHHATTFAINGPSYRLKGSAGGDLR